MADAWTIGRLLTWTADYLKQHGSESSRLEAEVLLAHAKSCRRIDLYAQFDQEADEPLRARFRELVKQRGEGTPVAYLVGHREFYSLDFRVTSDVLIPRPETETLVMTLLDLLPGMNRGGAVEVADVGTGSGVIGITVAKHASQTHVTAIDISPAALAIARENAERLGVAERMRFVSGDLLGSLAKEATFDIVASNPPYVSDRELEKLPRDVKEFEPKLALSAGETGTSVIERLIPQAAERLNAGGMLLLEISPMLQQPVEGLITAEARLQLVRTLKDAAGQPRVVLAKRT